jgi:hypothetical protein
LQNLKVRIANWFRSLAYLFFYAFERCTGCWKHLETKQVIKDTLDGYVLLEAEHRCIHCNSLEDYYAYGSHERDIWEHEDGLKHPIAKRLIKTLRFCLGNRN